MHSNDDSSHRRQFQAEFHRLATMTAVSLVVFGLSLLAIIIYAGSSSNASAVERERKLLQNSLERSIGRMLSEQKSVAWWDDSVTKITDERVDIEFTNANFGVFLTETYGHDEVYILNAKKRPLYAFAGAEMVEPSFFESRREEVEAVVDEVQKKGSSKLKARLDTFGTDQNTYSIWAGTVELARWSGHIVMVNEKMSLVTAITILPNTDMHLLTENPNILVSVRHINEDFVSTIAKTLLMNDLSIHAEPGSSIHSASEALQGDDGTSAGYFVWTPQRPGGVLLGVILPLVATGLLGVGGLASGILGRLHKTSSTLARSQAQALYAARHDSLSGLPNRVHFVEKLRETLEVVDVTSRDNKAIVAFIDLDNFKDVNDTLGHHAGDSLIRAVAARLQSHLRASDFLARYGGDEFAVLWTAGKHQSGAALGERVAKAFEAPLEFAGQVYNVSASVGIAVAPEHGSTESELLRHADIALYEAKKRGRKRAILFSWEMEHEVFERREMELDLQRAIVQNEFHLVYQPIIAASSGSVSGVEALLRWAHPEKGEISPGAFIPVAERSGLMPQLGEWVLARVMQDSARWPDLEVSVNLSPVQFKQVDFLDKLRGLVAAHGVDPRRFVLEITEGVLLESSERTTNALSVIYDMGFRTALDDFGTGYSSLAYLTNFRFDKIKIDRSFVSGMSKSIGYQKIVRAVVALGRGLGMDLVAEGVETESEARKMTALGCSELQGYYFAKPLSVEDLDCYLESHKLARVDTWRGDQERKAVETGL